MPNDPACGTGPVLPADSPCPRSFEDIHDDALRAKNIVHAARLLGMEVSDLTGILSPPILFLLFEAGDALNRLCDDLSELEHRAGKGRITTCQ